MCARFGPEGKRLATGGRDKTIALWSLRGGSLERTLEGHDKSVNVLSFSPTGELVSGDDGGGLRIWSWPRGKLITELDEIDAPIYTLACSADGELIAAGAGDECIYLFARSEDELELVHRLEVGPRGMSFVFGDDGEHIVSGRDGDTLCFWSLETGELAYEQYAGPGMVGALEPDRTGRWVVSRGGRGPVTIWEAENWSYTAVLPIIEKGLGGATLRPEHEQVVCIWEHHLGLFDAQTGETLAESKIPSKRVYALDVSPDGRFAVTGSADKLARVWTLGE